MVDAVQDERSMTTLEACRCLQCSSVDFSSSNDRLECKSCGAEYDIFDGIPCLVSYQPADALSLIEVLSILDERRVVANRSSYESWFGLLNEYHPLSPEERKQMTDRLGGSFGVPLPYRYRQFEQAKHLTDGIDFKGKKILDVGAGEGFDTFWFVKWGGDITAIEFGPLLAKNGRSAVPDARWLSASAHALPFGDESFDVVTCMAALHHITDPVAAISEMLRVTKVGGYIFTISDSFRANRRIGDETVFNRFNKEPAVLRGVNEGIPRFAEFFASLPHKDELEISIVTQRLYGYPDPETKSRQNYEALKHWKWPEDAERLSDSDGGMSLRIRKKGRTPINAPKLAAPIIMPRDFLSVDDRSQAMAKLAASIPREFVNQDFPGTELNTKFNLLNGWMMLESGDNFRRAYRRARRFMLNEAKKPIAIEIGLPASANQRSFRVLVNGEQKHQLTVSGGEWKTVQIPSSDVSGTSTCAVEIWQDGDAPRFDDGVFYVRQFNWV